MSALALVVGAGGDGNEVGMLVKLAAELLVILAAERENQRVRLGTMLKLSLKLSSSGSLRKLPPSRIS
jgi:hypothetical protein